MSKITIPLARWGVSASGGPVHSAPTQPEPAVGDAAIETCLVLGGRA